MLQINSKDFLNRAQNEQVNKRMSSGRTMARELCEETNAEIVWSFEKELGLGKVILEGRINGKRGRGRPRRQWERDIEDAFNRPVTEAGRLPLDNVSKVWSKLQNPVG